MGSQYQNTQDSFAASPQAADPNQVQNAGNQTLGKSLEQSPTHDGFGTRSAMYDNGMDVSSQPAPVAQPPQPQNQPATAGITPSWAGSSQQGRRYGGRARRADGGILAGSNPATSAPSGGTPQQQQAAGLAAFNAPGPAQGFAQAPLAAFGSMYNQPNSMMMTGDTLARFGQMDPNLLPPQVQAAMQAQQAANQPAPPAGQTAQGGPTSGPPAGLTVPASSLSTLPPDVLAKMPASTSPALKYTSTAQNLPGHYQNYDASVSSQNLPTDQFLNAAYQQYMGRDPDPEGLKYWTDALTSGTTTQGQIEASLADYANQSGNFINQVFQSDVGRNPSQQEAQYWTDQLNKGLATRQDVENAIMNSPAGDAFMQSQAVTPDVGGSVDPYVASYNAGMSALQNQFGNQALLNYLQGQNPTPNSKTGG